MGFSPYTFWRLYTMLFPLAVHRKGSWMINDVLGPKIWVVVYLQVLQYDLLPGNVTFWCFICWIYCAVNWIILLIFFSLKVISCGEGVKVKPCCIKWILLLRGWYLSVCHIELFLVCLLGTKHGGRGRKIISLFFWHFLFVLKSYLHSLSLQLCQKLY